MKEKRKIDMLCIASQHSFTCFFSLFHDHTFSFHFPDRMGIASLREPRDFGRNVIKTRSRSIMEQQNPPSIVRQPVGLIT